MHHTFNSKGAIVIKVIGCIFAFSNQTTGNAFQLLAAKHPAEASCFPVIQIIYAVYLQTSSAISFTNASFAHCSSSVSLLPISQEAKPHCGLRYSLSRGM